MGMISPWFGSAGGDAIKGASLLHIPSLSINRSVRGCVPRLNVADCFKRLVTNRVRNLRARQRDLMR